MTKPLVLTIACAALASCSNPVPTGNADSNAAAASATAQAAIPDLKGNWVGTSEGIVLGTAKHHEAAPGPTPKLDNVEFDLVIKGQDGHRFWGDVQSKYSKDFIVGVIEHDGKSILARTSEGEIRGTIADPDTVDLTYSSGSGQATVLSINSWKRQK